jgi:hypothetical protein
MACRLATDRPFGSPRDLLCPPSFYFLGCQELLLVIEAAKELGCEAGAFFDRQPQCFLEHVARLITHEQSILPATYPVEILGGR